MATSAKTHLDPIGTMRKPHIVLNAYDFVGLSSLDIPGSASQPSHMHRAASARLGIRRQALIADVGLAHSAASGRKMKI